MRENGPQDWSGFLEELHRVKVYLERSRPTAVNLSAALDRIEVCCQAMSSNTRPEEGLKFLLNEAGRLEAEDQLFCERIAAFGQGIIPARARILTHCNAGALATAGIGTALGIIGRARASGKDVEVFADETRPLLQGSRLTAWELQRRGVRVTLICDSMAAWTMKERGINLVLVGADRIVANGDTANKIGTYGLALLAEQHRIPFYVAAPVTSFDLKTANGRQIPIEERPPAEITSCGGRPVAAAGVRVYNPAFDVTPGKLVSAFITDRGIIRPPYDLESFRRAFV
ncbi:MAG: Methylthioribose-1-phosphate isomerase [candidate division TA06 bacterium ADurb.Bin417]|uniref:Methylthioribose-1-phosphate isomerase n=1 Tax=candidate division TA06 bacterium ADurb.Bin417 TaxID=1852828 RepID=A0A1V5MA60_UNCT6|nr:MAG: Methylthioribose-1-phosphate isomerase [candidate division TA06 bacterium ADurb.Bin417]